MVFGALLGGAVTRAGERFQEAAERQRRTEDWQRQNSLGLQLEFFTKNYGNMTPEQQEAAIGGIAPLIGMKPKELSPLIGGMKAIHSTLPPQYMDAQGLGAPRGNSTVAVTPSKEPAVRGIEAPASIEIGQIPQPSDIGSAAIMAPRSGHTASLPSQTPNELLSQRKFEQDKAIRRQHMIEIDEAPIPEHLKAASRAKVVGGINAVPVITSEIGADSRERMAESKAGQFQGSGRLIIRNGMPLPIRGTGNEEFLLDPQSGQWVPYIPAQGDQVYEKPIPRGVVAGASDNFAYNRDPRESADATAMGTGVRQKATASGRGGAAASRGFRDKMALRKDFENHPITKQADETARQVKLATSALSSGSPNFVAIDQALINVFNKMIDPNSVVREGEYSRTIENTPLLNRIKGKMAAVLAGGAGLTNEERAELVAISKRFASDSQLAFGTRAEEFKRMAKENEWNPNDIVVPRAGGGDAGGDTKLINGVKYRRVAGGWQKTPK